MVNFHLGVEWAAEKYLSAHFPFFNFLSLEFLSYYFLSYWFSGFSILKFFLSYFFLSYDPDPENLVIFFSRIGCFLIEMADDGNNAGIFLCRTPRKKCDQNNTDHSLFIVNKTGLVIDSYLKKLVFAKISDYW